MARSARPANMMRRSVEKGGAVRHSVGQHSAAKRAGKQPRAAEDEDVEDEDEAADRGQGGRRQPEPSQESAAKSYVNGQEEKRFRRARERLLVGCSDAPHRRHPPKELTNREWE
eukprot:scaffold19178_cov129-Isochrysis_galbana.AAC.2